MMNVNSQVKPFLLVGNHPCLDFINTRKNSKNGRLEMLESFTDVLDWFHAAGLLDDEQREQTREWETSPKWVGSLDQMTTSIIDLRDRLEKELLDHVIKGRLISSEFLKFLNTWLKTYKTHTEIRPVRENGANTSDRTQPYSVERIIVSDSGPEQLKAWIAEFIAGFLSAHDLSLVHQCGSPDCILFFYDNSKNHTRRWCSMQPCGNRMKAAEYYRKKKDNA
jgi:predicted RNA-binding Zn ribbon-like protein